MKDGRYVLEEMGTESMLKSRVLNTFNRLNNSQKVREIFSTVPNRKQRYDHSTLINLVPRHGQEFNNYANFAHWLLEDLPRLQAYKRHVSATDCQAKILIKTNPPRWMVDTLKCLGFDQDDWVEWNQSSGLIETLVVPKMNYIHSSGSRFSPSGREWVGNQIKSNCSSDTSEFSKNIIISRQKSKRRRISNFDEVMKALGPLGFESYQLEDLSIGEEISLFSQANIIVGVHGAGLATSIYSKNATLIEIFPYDVIATTYYILANEMGLEYAYLTGERNVGKHTDSKKNQDIKINIDKLVSTVSGVIESYP
jgi:capsular polysaccharide biosynthesis protein